MSDDEDFSSSDDESSLGEELNASSGKLGGARNDPDKSKGGVLTLEDNDDDESEFQRPDLAAIYAEDDGEGEEEGESAGPSEDEIEGECESITPKMAARNRLKKSTAKRTMTGQARDSAKAKAKIKSAYEDELKKNGKKKKKKPIGICMVATKYECVRRVAKKLGFKELDENEDWSLYWTDTSVSIDRVNQMKKWQKINHFPGMSEICRKDFLTRNMNRMMKLYPKDYTFYPKAWCLPADYADFINYARLKKNKAYICKPDSGCQGRGIFLTKNPFKDIRPGDNYVAQVYVSRPFTIDGFKFDLRVYVAVTSCDPFRIFVYKEGLARFTTQSYEEPTQINCKDVFMHLTNYAIQKRSDEFIRDEESGTKRRISTINKWLRENGYDVDKLWADIDDVVIKVLLSAHAVLKHNYRTCFANHYKGSACFEILGYDILVDKKLKPYVLEVNHSPSFTTDSKLDREIKDALIYDTIMLVNMGSGDKRKCIEEERKKVRERLFLKQGKKETKEELDEVLQEWLKHIEKWEDKHMGNFRRIYPAPGTDKYDRFFNTTGTLFSETAASRARIEQAKQQMEEISRKNEKFVGLVNKNQQKRSQSKEVRGESPVRKFSTVATATAKVSSSTNPNRLAKAHSQQNLALNNSSASNLAAVASNSQSTESSAIHRRPSSINRININHQMSSNSMVTSQPIQPIHPFQQTYMNLQAKQVQVQSAGGSSPSSLQLESWRPFEINENDEMERVHSLKQRETLIKGMGVDEMVYKLLSGTNGTAAAHPNGPVGNEVGQRVGPVQFTDASELNLRHNYSSKLELRAKNFNPFEGEHSLLAEKFVGNQQVLRSGSRPGHKTAIAASTGGTNGNNSLNLSKIRAKLNSTSSNLSSQPSDLTGIRYPVVAHPATVEAVVGAASFQPIRQINRKGKTTTRYPLEIFSKAESMHHGNAAAHATINGYRIKSAQHIAKQKPSGLYIFSYQVPPD